MAEIVVPQLGEEIKEVTCAYWHVKPGDFVAADDDVVELVTDKATFNVPAGANGVVKEILVTAGENAKIGAKLATLE